MCSGIVHAISSVQVCVCVYRYCIGHTRTLTNGHVHVCSCVNVLLYSSKPWTTHCSTPCRFAEAPTAEQAKEFISVCKTFFQKNPVDVVGVHCTHGFNRTGFFIVAYLVEEENWRWDWSHRQTCTDTHKRLL